MYLLPLLYPIRLDEEEEGEGAILCAKSGGGPAYVRLENGLYLFKEGVITTSFF